MYLTLLSQLKRAFLLLLLLSTAVIAVAQTPESKALVAALNFNFAKYASWPDIESKPAIELCYFNDSVRQSFGGLSKKQLFNKPVNVRQLRDIEEASQCQLLFIDSTERSLLQRLFVHLRNKPVLTVSDISGFTDEGGMIEILRVENKLRFKVNLTQMQRADLVLSSQVLKLAVEVK
jgi:hypothetical protein